MASSSLSALHLLTLSLLAGIACCDLVWRKVPNMALLLLAVIVLVATPWSPQAAGISLLILLLGIVAFHYQLLGAGDSKLLALCAYASLEQWPFLLLYTALIGGILSGICLFYNRFAYLWVAKWQPVRTVPYAVAISCAASVTIHYM